MKTKAEIVQKLLEESKITAEDAVVLLTPVIVEKLKVVEVEKNPWIINTPYPYDPAPLYPYRVTCGTATIPANGVLNNLTLTSQDLKTIN